MLVQMFGWTMEKGAGGFLSIRHANGTELLMQPCRGTERGLWGAVREPGSWEAWAGRVHVMVCWPVEQAPTLRPVGSP